MPMTATVVVPTVVASATLANAVYDHLYLCCITPNSQDRYIKYGHCCCLRWIHNKALVT